MLSTVTATTTQDGQSKKYTQQQQPVPHRRGHAHKRSAAISGDFDAIGMDFFRAPPNANQKIVQSSTSLPKDSFLNQKQYHLPAINAPSFVITDVTESSPPRYPPPKQQQQNHESKQVENHSRELTASTPSPQKKHTRLNSWAHSFMKPKKNELKSSTTSSKVEYNSSSSNEATPDKTTQFTYNNNNGKNNNNNNNNPYHVPEALIDLDLASGILHDPNSKIPRKKIMHRRTESAPELEDFLKYKVFSNTSNNNNNSNGTQKNPAIFEEDEEDDMIDEDAISSASSTNNNIPSTNNKNDSTNSLSSYPSFKLQSPATVNNSVVSTPTSIKTNATQQQQHQSTRRGGATAARYQSYYNNSLLLSNALKSSESLSQITNSSNHSNNLQNKTSISSFNSKFIMSSNSSTNSSMLNSPSRFKFESKVYDPPSQQEQCFATSNSPPSSSSSSTASFSKQQQPTITSPTKSSKKLYIHKKSNSLLSSINLKKYHKKNSSSSSNIIKNLESDKENQSDDEEDIGDSTITPFNFGEPGPELDLTTMTPKLVSSSNSFNYLQSPYKNNTNNDTHFNDNEFEVNHTSYKKNTIKSPKKEQNASSDNNSHHHHHGHKKFFNWLKK